MFIHENADKWNVIERDLQNAFEILNSMQEKPMMQADLLNMIETARIQATLWQAKA